jgi:hypothetical protein
MALQMRQLAQAIIYGGVDTVEVLALLGAAEQEPWPGNRKVGKYLASHGQFKVPY